MSTLPFSLPLPNPIVKSTSAPSLISRASLNPPPIQLHGHPADHFSGLNRASSQLAANLHKFARSKSPKNIEQLSTLLGELSEDAKKLPTLRQVKSVLTGHFGFKRQGENYFGPKGMQAHVDMGAVGKYGGHGDHLDLTQSGWKKIRFKLNPDIRFE